MNPVVMIWDLRNPRAPEKVCQSPTFLGGSGLLASPGRDFRFFRATKRASSA